jgi:hypothetical protein
VAEIDLSEMARRYDIDLRMLRRWKREVSQHDSAMFKGATLNGTAIDQGDRTRRTRQAILNRDRTLARTLLLIGCHRPIGTSQCYSAVSFPSARARRAAGQLSYAWRS